MQRQQRDLLAEDARHQNVLAMLRGTPFSSGFRAPDRHGDERIESGGPVGDDVNEHGDLGDLPGDGAVVGALPVLDIDDGAIETPLLDLPSEIEEDALGAIEDPTEDHGPPTRPAPPKGRIRELRRGQAPRP